MCPFGLLERGGRFGGVFFLEEWVREEGVKEKGVVAEGVKEEEGGD